MCNKMNAQQIEATIVNRIRRQFRITPLVDRNTLLGLRIAWEGYALFVQPNRVLFLDTYEHDQLDFDYHTV